MRKLFLAFVALLVINQLSAQDLRLGYFQSNHMFLLNPAEVVHDPEQIFLEYGRKWSQLASPPEAFQLGGVYHPVKELAFGGIVNRASSGILDSYHVGISTAYKINLNQNQTLSAGINTYLKNFNTDTGNMIADLNDPLLNGGVYDKIYFGLGIGLSYTIDRVKVHVSIPETHDKGDYGIWNFANAGASYNFLLEEFQLTPSINYFGSSVENMVEGMIMGSWKNTLSLGAAYRSNKAYNIRLEFQSGSVAVGYALGTQSGNYSTQGVSNNFSVRYLFKRKIDDTHEKINNLVSTNDRILSKLEHEIESSHKVQQEILKRLDSLTNQQEEVKDIQQNFLEKFEEADRRNTVDEATKQKLAPGYYLVIYSFHESTELKKIKEELLSMPFESKLIHDKEKAYYYITTKRYDTLEMAVIAMQNIHNQGFEDAWIHWYK